MPSANGLRYRPRCGYWQVDKSGVDWEDDLIRIHLLYVIL